MILKFINLNSKHKILSYPKITKIQETSKIFPQLLHFHNPILSPISQTLISLSQQKEIIFKYWRRHIENMIN